MTTYLILSHLSNNIVVLIVNISRHQVISRRRPTVGINVPSLWLCEVGRCEALDGISDVLLREDGQSQEEEDQQRVLAIQFVHAIVYGDVDPTD